MADSRWAISSGSKFEELAGYSRAVVDGEWVFVSGTSGFVPETGAIAEDAAEQARESLRTIGTALKKAGASLSDIVQVRVYIAERADVTPVSRVLGETFLPPRPTNTTILCGFAVPEIKVEIEVVALVRGRAG